MARTLPPVTHLWEKIHSQSLIYLCINTRSDKTLSRSQERIKHRNLYWTASATRKYTNIRDWRRNSHKRMSARNHKLSKTKVCACWSTIQWLFFFFSSFFSTVPDNFSDSFLFLNIVRDRKKRRKRKSVRLTFLCNLSQFTGRDFYLFISLLLPVQ